MLAGLPVLANSRLRCGLHYVTPETGRVADEEAFPRALCDLIDAAPALRPRDVVLARWVWAHSVHRLRSVLARSAKGRALGFR